MHPSTALAPGEREQSILDQMPQVKLLAARLHRRCPPNVLLDDLVSAGVTGLIEATDRYDRQRNLKLKTLAEHRIRGAMLDYLRELDPLPRAVRRFIRDRDSATANLEDRLHHASSDAEVAAFLCIPIKRYRDLSRIAQADVTVGLDRIGDAGRHPHDVPAPGDRTPDFIALGLAIESLPARERTVILLLRAGYTTSEIAHQLEVSRSDVLQMKRDAIVRLRIALGVVPANRSRPVTCKTQVSERMSL
jgi:RNA polymerase sigma factor FliA